MAKKPKINIADKLREIEEQLRIIENEEFVDRDKWIRSPDFEANFKKPERARISNWDRESDFYNDYNNSNAKAKTQLLKMVQRIFLLTENEKYNIFRKTFSKKNFVLALLYTSIAIWIAITLICTWSLVTGKAQQQGTAVYIILAVAFSLITGGVFYILFKIIRFRWYSKSTFLQNYFGKWYSFENPKFEFSNEKLISTVLNAKTIANLETFPELFSEQDFLNFKALFFREFYFYDSINPSYKYKSKYNFTSLAWQIVFWVFILSVATAITFIILMALGIGS